MSRLPLPSVDHSPETVSTDSDNESMSSSSVDEPFISPSVAVSSHQLQAPSSALSTTQSATTIIGTVATSAITYALMSSTDPALSQKAIAAVTAFGAGVAANVVLNSELLRPLITRVDEWINEGMRLFQDWTQDQNDLASRRYNHTSLDDRIWSALLNHRCKVVASGLVLGGITFKWQQIIEFIKKVAPGSWAEGLEKMLQLRNQLEIIINSPAAFTAGVVVALATVAYGLHIAYGASQQLKELKTISFQPVMHAFDDALNQFIASIQSANASAARVNAAFSRFEQAAIVTQDKLTSTIRQVTYHHNKALKMKDRAKLVGHIAAAAGAVCGAGAICSGIKAAQGGLTVLAAAKVALSTKSAALSFLFLAGCGSCEYGSHRCQLVIEKCEELQQEAKEMLLTIRTSFMNTKEEMEVLLERVEIRN